jgi:DNA-binding MarR family transcriptional regulator
MRAAQPTARRFDSPQQEAFLSLWRTYDRLKALEDELFNRYELTAQQYNALRLLRGSHPDRLRALDLTGRLVSRAPDVTRLVDRLAERGLVERQRSREDRRSVKIGITEAGRALLDQLASEVRDCHLRQLGHLAPEELEQLLLLLRKAREPHEDADSAWR